MSVKYMEDIWLIKNYSCLVLSSRKFAKSSATTDGITYMVHSFLTSEMPVSLY